MKKVAIFASGNGSNFEALLKTKYKDKEIVLLICDNSEAYVIKRANKYNIETLIFDKKQYKNKKAFEEDILLELIRRKIDFICLAGYMRIIGKTLLTAFDKKMINIHPALLPSFKGANGIKDAYEYGVKVMGVTVHYVNDTIDGGRIIDQMSFHITNETLEEVEKRIHEIEHILYPRVLEEVLL